MKAKKFLAAVLASITLVATPLALPIGNDVSIFSSVTMEASAATRSITKSNVNIGNVIYDLYSDSTATVKSANEGATSVTIPETVSYSGKKYTVTTVKLCAFANNNSLKAVYMSSAKGIKSLPSYTFQNSKYLTTVTLPNQLTSIPGSCFDGCTSLTSCNMPTSLIMVENNAFMNTKLTKASFSTSLVSIGKNAFKGCSNLTKVTWSSSLLDIGDYAFYGTALSGSITLPSKTRTIGNYAFMNSKLSGVTIPDSVTKIGTQAFYGCKNLTSLIMNPTNRIICDMAFTNINSTFYSKTFTTSTFCVQNAGSANKAIGNQLVVNLFVDEITAQSDLSLPSYSPDAINSAFMKSNGVNASNSYFIYNTSKNKITIYSKSSMEFTKDEVNWNPSLCSSSNSMSAVCLNNDTNKGKKVSSEAITERLTNVKNGLSILEKQAKEYGKDLRYIYDSDNNFYMTIDCFTPDVTRTSNNGAYQYLCLNRDSIKDGVNNLCTYDGTKSSLKSCSVWNQFKDKSASIAGVPDVDLFCQNGQLSAYSNYLIQKYKNEKNISVSGVVYILHTLKNGDISSYGAPAKTGQTGCEEFAVIGMKDDEAVIAHEVTHIYGAYDQYTETRNNQLTLTARIFFGTYIHDELMVNCGRIVDAFTAYSIGWRNEIEKEIYNIAYAETPEQYTLGDVDLDGKVTDGDFTLLSNHIKNPTTTVLSPLQKVTAGEGYRTGGQDWSNWNKRVVVTTNASTVSMNFYDSNSGVYYGMMQFPKNDLNLDCIVDSSDLAIKNAVIKGTTTLNYFQQLIYNNSI